MITFGTLFTESVKEVEDLNEQIQLLDEMPGANMDTRAVHKHLKKQGWSLTRSSGGHDVFTHPDAKHHIPVPRHRQLKAPLVRGILKQSEVRKEEVELDEARVAASASARSGLAKRNVGQPKKSNLSPAEQQAKNKESDDSFARLMAYAAAQKSKANEEVEQLEEAGNKALEPHIGMGDSRTPRELKTQMSGASDDFVKSTASKKPGVFHSKVSRMQTKLAKSELRKRTNEEVEQLEEGRPSQRHPLEGHEYHKKTNAELEYIAKDAHKAAEAMKSHNTDAENKYRDQASDSATVRYFRQKNGMPNWYKKKYGHVNEEVVEEGAKSAGVGWMLKADPKLGAKVDANKKKYKAFKKAVGNKDAGVSVTTVKEDNVINTNSVNSVHAQPKKKETPEVERYVTGQSKQVAGTNVVASPRESVQEGVAMDIAKRAARRNAGLKEDNDNTLSSYDKEDTPAKKTLSKTAGMVKDLATNAKAKAKGKKSDDTFQPEPELASNIVR